MALLPACLSGELTASSFSKLFVLILSVFFSITIASGQASRKRNVLIITEVGLSHTLTSLILQQVVADVRETADRHVEFYSESLDLMSFPNRPSREEVRDWLKKKYGSQKLDVVVAAGPDTVSFLSNYTQNLFLEVPIVICGSAAGQAGNLRLDSRYTGTWLRLEPAKTLEVAFRLFPNTQHIFVVGGSSAFDGEALALTKEGLSSFHAKADLAYLTGMEMSKLLELLGNLPEHSIVLYTSLFEDAAGNKFVNATKALPMVAAASNAPVFGMSDTYMGHGIIGGDVLGFENQAKVTARIVSELLDGKKADDLPIETLPSVYMFDWKVMQRWHVRDSSLPPGSVVLFREPGLWDRNKWAWAMAFLIILALTGLTAYLQHSRKQLQLAKEGQRRLSGMLINAEEQERSRLASELHDDFSQRLAVVALGLENVEEAVPAAFQEAHQQLRELVNSTSEIGADLHTLSHRLHSSALESLGLVPAVTALCKEFNTKQGVKIEIVSEGVPRSVPPDIALCVFRIVQEGLRNLRKHSGAGKALVDLRTTGDRLDVTVQDEGRGFDLKGLRQKEGLGIRSMRERARLLGGKFEIHSEPGKGTIIKAWVPLKAEPGVEKS